MEGFTQGEAYRGWHLYFALVLRPEDAGPYHWQAYREPLSGKNAGAPHKQTYSLEHLKQMIDAEEDGTGIWAI